MIKLLFKIISVCSLLLVAAHSVLAQDVTLSWDASPTADIAGYNVYYKFDNPTLPFDSVGAAEGPSPIDAGNNLTTTLTELPDNTLVYFSVTAYDTDGNESTFSNIVSNSWTPELLSPENLAVNEPVPATFQWTTEPSGEATYTLYFGTDADMVANAGAVRPFAISPQQTKIVVGCLGFVALLLIFARVPVKRKIIFASGFLATSLILTACGGGGGGGGETSSKTSTQAPSSTVSAAVYTIDKGTSDYHQEYDLEPGTTYYWKVIGVDVSDSSQQFSSTVASFTTESF